jgi:Co/Zn/Cd efflux system component
VDHDHLFLVFQHKQHEWRAWPVVALTAIMMAGEIAAGSVSGTMALLPDR